MTSKTIYLAGITPAVSKAAGYLKNAGFTIVKSPTADTTHVLLDIPSCTGDGILKSGKTVSQLSSEIPRDAIIMGGNLPEIEQKSWDFLKDPMYVSENAAITAHCAVKEALWQLPVTLSDCSVLILGWGRIGKCLASLLRSMGADVCVAARKESDRALLSALGYQAIEFTNLRHQLPRFRVILNTVPAAVLSKEDVSFCQEHCMKIDLASQKGIYGDDVIWARGLPGTLACESSGMLIARTVMRYLQKEEQK